MRPSAKVRAHFLGNAMNYDDDSYINSLKQDEVKEGNPQPTSGYTKPDVKDNHQSDMHTARISLQDRGHTGSKYYPRG